MSFMVFNKIGAGSLRKGSTMFRGGGGWIVDDSSGIAVYEKMS